MECRLTYVTVGATSNSSCKSCLAGTYSDVPGQLLQILVLLSAVRGRVAANGPVQLSVLGIARWLMPNLANAYQGK
jgi:hypothetical protein